MFHNGHFGSLGLQIVPSACKRCQCSVEKSPEFLKQSVVNTRKTAQPQGKWIQELALGIQLTIIDAEGFGNKALGNSVLAWHVDRTLLLVCQSCLALLAHAKHQAATS